MKNIFINISNLFNSNNDLKTSDQHLAVNTNNTKTSNKNGAQRIRNLYDPSAIKPFKISRSKLELFIKCKRCFYIDRRLGVGHPDGYPLSLNLAVHDLLEKEFDIYRFDQKPHPLCIENNVNAIPFKHENLDNWRNTPHEGINYTVPNTNFIIEGGLDDVWKNLDTQELIVVDYKATSKKEAVDLEADWQISYKRQVEIYQWLLRKNGFKVSNVAYFVYCNGKKDLERFNNQLKFEVSLLPYQGDDSWVEFTVDEAYKCLQANIIPEAEKSCDYCQY